ncbi:hypothetical protein SAY86_011377 [Trapa natans]|uniref:Uncharacterized protein n=1 Tax=Trapa natans TaxID=22666 RepID=A0AAN7LN46_TRANT|nr:hypothetical protein SAY86_011377 [Trapa natans]
MFLIEDIADMLFIDPIISESFISSVTNTVSNTNCQSSDLEASCRNDSDAFKLKFVAMACILVAGMIGIAIPLLGRHRKFLGTDGSLFIATKAFAAGVILATGFVHMLSGGTKALSDPCLPDYPWTKFPFAGFFAMVAALLTLLVDFTGTQYYERKQGMTHSSEEQGRVGSVDTCLESGIEPVVANDRNGKVCGEEESGGVHILGMHAHVTNHRHNHSHGQEDCEGNVIESSHSQNHGHGHSHDFGVGEGDGLRHVVVSQILELGIVSHSVIIGLSLGVSESPCTIRPLIAALSFHQFFEGFALGGCIAQAQIRTISSLIMASFFTLTTPGGIGLGTAIASSYNPNSPRALVTEGILDCLSAGILVYMALVDLIAADFLSKRMSCNFRLQVVSYVMLFLGAGLMAMLAIWA